MITYRTWALQMVGLSRFSENYRIPVSFTMVFGWDNDEWMICTEPIMLMRCSDALSSRF